MRIAVISETSNDNVAQMTCALKNLGHNVINLSLLRKNALFPLKTQKIDAIIGVGIEKPELSTKLSMMAIFARIPIINFHWCFQNLSKLLGAEESRQLQQHQQERYGGYMT